MLNKHTALYHLHEIAQLIIDNNVLAKISMNVMEDSSIALSFIHYDDNYILGRKTIHLLDFYNQEEFDEQVEAIYSILEEEANETREDSRTSDHKVS